MFDVMPNRIRRNILITRFACDRYISSTLLAIGLAGLVTVAPRPLSATTTYSGVAAGDATENSAILWTRTVDVATHQGDGSELTVEISTDSQFKSVLYYFQGKNDAKRDNTLKIKATGLQSNTRYYYRFRTLKGELSPVGVFKTAPKPAQKVAVRFGFSGDSDGNWRPYPSTQDFNKLNLDFFVFLGDLIYETKNTLSEATTDSFEQPDRALEDYRRKYRENLEPLTQGGFPSLQTLYASQGNYTLLDNHELGNKQFINGGAPAGLPLGKGVDPTNPTNDVNDSHTYINKTPGFEVMMRAYGDYQPIRKRTIAAPNDPRTDKTQQLFVAQQWGANLIFISLDDRSYRDIRLKTPSGKDDTGSRADNPRRTMLGETQLNWLKQTLRQAQANQVTWKAIAISSPIDEGGEDGGKSWIGGYRAERNRILKFIAEEHINNVVFITTDDHMNRVNELMYFKDPKDLTSRTLVPHAFTVVAGPIGAGGPDRFTDHSFVGMKFLADALAGEQRYRGLDPIGLDPKFPGLQNVFREGDPDADKLRQPIDFFSPDTFNYATLDVSDDGSTLSVNIYGIYSYQAGTFLTAAQTGSPHRILGFQVKASIP